MAENQQRQTATQQQAAVPQQAAVQAKVKEAAKPAAREAAKPEYTCAYCQVSTSREFCPRCGRRVIPLVCPKCGASSLYDACTQCGTILDPDLERVIARESPTELVAMGDAEAAKIGAEFDAIESAGSAEFRAFQKKLVERQILLEERDYFNKREKRIVKVFGSRPFTLELPDTTEEAFRMKAYAALEKTIIAREERAIEAELERLFPPLAAAVTADVTAPAVDLEQKYRETLAKVNDEVETFRREEERKRLEEERQRRIAEERQRLEEERRRKRFNGVFYHMSHNGMLTAELRITDNQAVCRYRCTVCGHATIEYSVSINDDNITLIGGRKRGDNCTFAEYKLVENYRGTANNAGTILNGYWHKNGASVPIVFYKR